MREPPFSHTMRSTRQSCLCLLASNIHLRCRFTYPGLQRHLQGSIFHLGLYFGLLISFIFSTSYLNYPFLPVTHLQVSGASLQYHQEGSIVVLQKPMARVALADWHGKVWELRQTCDTRRKDAFDLRNEARQLRNETECKTAWDTYHNNSRLADRLLEVSRWRDALENSRRLIKGEMDELEKEKTLTEAEIEFLALNFTVVNESLTQRDQRGGADLCTDDAEIEIKHELKMLEALKVMFTNKCMAAWEQSNRLEEVQMMLTQDIENKDQAMTIDRDNLGLDKHGSNISYKPNAIEIPKNMISYESWVEHSRYLKLKADNELKASQQLRESMYVPRERARNDLKAQTEMTNFALRKRIYETKRIKLELEWQRLNMAADMEKMGQEVDRLESALRVKSGSLKLAQTRSENRFGRPGAECTRDEPAIGLIDEIKQIEATTDALRTKLENSKATFNALEDQLALIDRELAHKTYALTTDERCLELRKKLEEGHERAPHPTQTDRNIALTKLSDQLPPE